MRAAPVACIAAAALELAFATPVAAQAVSYQLDPEHSFVHFEVLHFGTSTLRGRFGPLQGVVTLDPEHQRGDVGVRVAAASVSTGLRVLDARLREADLLASDTHPDIFFVARNFRYAGREPVEVRGEFTLRGHSQGLSLRALRFGCRDDATRRREVCGGTFEGFFYRSEFGINFGLPLVANQVRLLVDVEGVRR